MATPRQIEATRLNAPKSTGPRSVEGKAASRLHAVKHGIDARRLVMPGEDSFALETLARDYREQFQPVGPLEIFLVDTLIQADWDRRRYAQAEAAHLSKVLTATEFHGDDKIGALYESGGAATLDRIFRRIQSAERSYFRALRELRRAQRERHDHDPGKPPGLAPAPPQPVALPSSNQQIGFVPPPPAVPSPVRDGRGPAANGSAPAAHTRPAAAGPTLVPPIAPAARRPLPAPNARPLPPGPCAPAHTTPFATGLSAVAPPPAPLFSSGNRFGTTCRAA